MAKAVRPRKKARILITGATGFVGRYLVAFLESAGRRNRGAKAKIFGTCFPEHPSQCSDFCASAPSVELVHLDLRDVSAVDQAVKTIKPDQVYHLAAISQVRLSWERRRETFDANLLGTFNLFEALRQCAPKARVLFVSSSDVYGFFKPHDHPYFEEESGNIVNPYAFTKAAGELLSEFYASVEKLPVIIARPFPHTGPGQSADFVFSSWARRIAEIERTPERRGVLNVGNLAIRRDYLDVRDIVRAYALLLAKGTPGEIYNISTEQAPALAEVLEILLSLSTAKVRIKVDRTKIRKTDIPYLAGSAAKIRNTTGWSPQISLKQTLADLLEDWRKRVPLFQEEKNPPPPPSKKGSFHDSVVVAPGGSKKHPSPPDPGEPVPSVPPALKAGSPSATGGIRTLFSPPGIRHNLEKNLNRGGEVSPLRKGRTVSPPLLKGGRGGFLPTKKGGKVLVTGGAGYIGSLLVGELLRRGDKVVVLDKLLFGGGSLLSYLDHPNFTFHNADVCDREAIAPYFKGVDAVVHLAAVVGYPACSKLGTEASFTCNLDGTRHAFELAEAAGARRFVFSSTYSNYGIAPDGKPVAEDSPLFPQSIYAETKIAAEKYLIERAAASRCVPVIYRFATLFGPSPRTRFDLIINQFVWEALTEGKLTIYQSRFRRSFVHVRDIVRAILLALDAPAEKVRGRVFNVGSNAANYTKEAVVRLIQKYAPDVEVEFKDLSFDGDMRDVAVSFDRIERELGWQAEIGVEEGIRELVEAVRSGILAKTLNGTVVSVNAESD